MAGSISRRDILKLAAGTAVTTLLAACGGTPATSAPPAAQPTVGGTALAGGTGGQALPSRQAGTAVAAGGTRTAAAAVPIVTVTPNAPNTAATGNVRYWQTTYDNPNLPSAQYHQQWAAQLKTALPNVQFKEEQLAYNDMLDKLRVALRANQGPDMAVLPILWGPEFAASGALAEIDLAEMGYKPENFWPGALKSVTWQGKVYGVPTNNETHGFIWNKELFQKAGLDPETPPKTWAEVQTFAKQIKDKTGKAGYGLVAKLNAGDIPFRFMPLCWAHGGAALDETADSPQYMKSGFDNDGTIAALQWVYDVFVRDNSAPQSALTNTGVENQNLLLSGEIAMMSGHPTTYALAVRTVPEIAEKLGYTMMPQGPVRRAVVFGGSNVVIFKGAKDLAAAKAVIKDRTSATWSLYHQWETSNPGNRDAFNLPAQQQRLTENRYLNVTTDNLQYGVSFPAIPESSDIMNLIVPQMMQDVMLKVKTPQQAAQEGAKKVNDLLAKRR